MALMFGTPLRNWGFRPAISGNSLLVNQALINAAYEAEELRLDRAEAAVEEALKSDDSRRKDAAAYFILRNSSRAKRRGWITTASASVDVNVQANKTVNYTFRWRTPTMTGATPRRSRPSGCAMRESTWLALDGATAAGSSNTRPGQSLRTKTNIQPLPGWSGRDADLVALTGQRDPRQGSGQNQSARHSNSYGDGCGFQRSPGVMPHGLRRRRERDDGHLVKPTGSSADIDPVEELIRVVSEAQERDAEDERRLYHPMRGDRPSSFQRRRPDRR